MKYMKFFIVMFALSSSVFAFSAGEKIPAVSVSESHGGYVDGGAFSSDDFKGKINLIVVVDPDKSEAGTMINEAIKVAKEDGRIKASAYQSYAIIDLASTWKPNWIISNVLDGKQKKFPTTKFVKDDASIIVKAWNISEDNYNMLIVNEQGNVLFHKRAVFTQDEANRAVEILIRETKRLAQ